MLSPFFEGINRCVAFICPGSKLSRGFLAKIEREYESRASMSARNGLKIDQKQFVAALWALTNLFRGTPPPLPPPPISLVSHTYPKPPLHGCVNIPYIPHYSIFRAEEKYRPVFFIKKRCAKNV